MKYFIQKKWSKRLVMFTVPIVIGLIILLVIKKNRLQPLHIKQVEKMSVVRIIKVQSVDFVPRILGYGNAMPARTWDAVAETSGKILRISPQLKKGPLFLKEQFCLS